MAVVFGECGRECLSAPGNTEGLFCVTKSFFTFLARRWGFTALPGSWISGGSSFHAVVWFGSTPLPPSPLPPIPSANCLSFSDPFLICKFVSRWCRPRMSLWACECVSYLLSLSCRPRMSLWACDCFRSCVKNSDTHLETGSGKHYLDLSPRNHCHESIWQVQLFFYLKTLKAKN